MKSPFDTEANHDGSAGREAGDGVAASPAASGLDAPPSNRASNRCNQVRFQVLSRHIDSLEVSVPGQLRPDRGQKLEKLKELAQSRQEERRAQAQLVVAGRCFEVRDKGAGMFPFVLSDDRFYIKLSRPGNTSLPLAYCQIRNAHLLHVGPREAASDLRRVLDELGDSLGREVVSRVDLAVDFVTEHPINAWPAKSWVTRLDYKHSYSDGDHFTGWSIGRKSSLQFGLYDKTHEIKTVSHKEYLYELWDKAGWAPWDSVWRAEARLRRATLA